MVAAPPPITDAPAVSAAQSPEVGRDALFALLYRELRRLARAQLRRTGPITLLDTTGLVHEAWLRLAGNATMPLDDPGWFMAYTSRVMRFVVIDFVRQRHTARRGGGQLHITLDTGIADMATLHDAQLLQLHETLGDLARIDARLVQVVEMRCFGGMSDAEIGQALGVTDRTVRRHWAKARALLHAAMR